MILIFLLPVFWFLGEKEDSCTRCCGRTESRSCPGNKSRTYRRKSDHPQAPKHGRLQAGEEPGMFTDWTAFRVVAPWNDLLWFLLHALFPNLNFSPTLLPTSLFCIQSVLFHSYIKGRLYLCYWECRLQLALQPREPWWMNWSSGMIYTGKGGHERESNWVTSYEIGGVN